MPRKTKLNLQDRSLLQNHQPEQTSISYEQQVVPIFRRLLITLAAFGLFYGVIYLLFYLQTKLPQLLVATGAILVSLFLLPLVFQVVKRGRATLAGSLILVGSGLLFVANELVWSGMTLYQFATGIVLLFLVGRILLPRKAGIWGIVITLYAAGVLLVNIYQPLERYNANQSVFLNTFTLACNSFLIVLLTLQLIQIIQPHTIRVRLLSVFIILVVAPTIASSATSYILGSRNSEESALKGLQTVVALKETTINNWKENALESLRGTLPLPDAYSTWEVLLLETALKPDEQKYLSAYKLVKSRLQRELLRTDLFEEIFIIDTQGNVLVSTTPEQENTNKRIWPYFEKGLQGPFINPPFIDPSLERISMVAVVPVEDPIGGITGILAGRINMQKLNDIMRYEADLGATAETYLVRKSYTLLTDSRFAGWIAGTSYIWSEGTHTAIEQRVNGSGRYMSYRGTPVLGVYYWLPDLEMVLLAEQEQVEIQAIIYPTLLANWGVGIIALLAAILAAFFATRRITQPLDRLARTAERIAEGNLEQTASIAQQDEIGALAASFNKMTAQLRDFINNLEGLIAERTTLLENRSLQLQVAADLARDTTAIYDQEELLVRAVNLICDRLGFYYAGIFLVDEHNQYAILKAATGEAGKAMLERSHQLRIGEEGIVGFVTGSGQARTADNVDDDTAHYKNPLLPDTRSELALPLKAGGRVIGALDVQSTQMNAFATEDIRMLQTMADQLALAIENARLFQEMGQTVRQLEAAQAEFTQASWRSYSRRPKQTLGYRYRGLGVESSTDISEQALIAVQSGRTLSGKLEGYSKAGRKESGGSLAVPIKLRDQVVGVIDLRLGDETISDETISTFEEIASRFALALESSRLLEESQLRSDQIRFLQEITATAASHVRMQELLENVCRQILTGFDLMHCGIVFLDADKKTGTVTASVSKYHDPAADVVGEKIPIEGNELTQEVMSTRKAVVVYDAQNNPRTTPVHELMKKRGCNTLILAPLLSRGEAIGTIGLDIADPERHISQEDMTLIEQISLQLAVAIEVARMFEQTEYRAQRERMVSDITSRMRQSLDVDTVLKTAAEEIRRSLGLKEVTIRLGEPKRTD